ncbi:hypothetical protein [Inquilinus sp. CA228]|uniref:hypothetical protein n=1 Tax=Inquilinus sp. CA228 TaxID=3455609 RepID=UPI003F8D06DD
MPTADQIKVQILVNVDQYSKSMAKVAGDTTRYLAMVQQVVTDTEVTVTRSWDHQAAASEQGSRRRAKAAQDGAAAEQTAAAQSAMATERIGRDTERLTVRVQSATRQRAMLAREAAASGREMAGGIGGAFKSLLSVFGPIGKVVEFVADSVQIADFVMSRFIGSTEEANQALELYRQTLEDYLGTARQATLGSQDLAASFGKMSEAAQAVAANELKAQIEAQSKGIDAAAKEAVEKLRAAGVRYQEEINIPYGEFPQTIPESFSIKLGVEIPTDLQARLEAALKPLMQGSRDTTYLKTLYDQLQTLGNQADGPAKTAILNLVNQVAGLSAGTQASISQIDLFMARLRLLFGTATDADRALINAAAATDQLGNSAAGAQSKVAGLTDEVRRYYQELGRANGAAVMAGLDADRMLERARRELDELRTYGNTDRLSRDEQVQALVSTFVAKRQTEGYSEAEAREQGNAAETLFRQVLAERDVKRSPASGGGGARSAAPAAPASAPGEEALASLQREIDLNRALAAVYHLGKEALAKKRAEQEAINAARQAGLAAGSKEYEAYFEDYRLKALDAEQSKTRLANLERGSELNKSLMSEQEKLNLLKADYNTLLQEGAITQVAHDRLVATAEDQAYGYSEGIKAIGEAIQGGIQGATSFSDALLKIGNSLAQLLLQAALFGNGPLGKLFGSLTGLPGGLLGLAFGGGGGGLVQPPGSPIAVPIPGLPPGRASGGQALPGNIYEVGETGREWFAPSVPGQVIPNHVIKAAAGGGGGSSQPITFNISMAGANGDRTIAEIAAAAVKKGLTSVPEINRQHRIRFA